MYFLLNMVIFHSYVSLPEGKLKHTVDIEVTNFEDKKAVDFFESCLASFPD